MKMLGRIPSTFDHRTLKLSRYLTIDPAALPDEVRWDAPVKVWGVQGNDRYGNCVIVTAAHALQAWNANDANLPDPISDSAVIELSREMGALNGYMILERLKWWRMKGMFSNRLWAYAQIAHASVTAHIQAIATFGCSDVGLAMPAGWQNQEVWGTGTGRQWRAGSWGLHSVPLVGYDLENFYCVTWGKIQPMTHAALLTYCDEAWALINPSWIGPDAHTPTGLDLARLRADLTAIDQD